MSKKYFLAFVVCLMVFSFSGCLLTPPSPSPSPSPSPLTPAITELSPQEGKCGTDVTIVGSNFGDTQGEDSAVLFEILSGESRFSAEIISWSNTQIVANVPCISAGKYNVYVNVSGMLSNKVEFTISPSPSPTEPSPSPTSPPSPSNPLAKNFSTLGTAEEKLKDMAASGMGMAESIDALALWLKEQPDVTEVIVEDYLIEIQFSSGLNSTIMVYDSSSGFMIYGGSSGFIPSPLGGSSTLSGSTTTTATRSQKVTNLNQGLAKSALSKSVNTSSRNVITINNRKVFFWEPLYLETSVLLKCYNAIADSPLPFLPPTFKYGSEANIDSLRNITDYGLVILLTHGENKWLLTGEGVPVSPASGQPLKYLSDIVTGKIGLWLTFDFSNPFSPIWSYKVSDKWFRANLQGRFENTVIINLSCDGAKAPYSLWNAFHDKGAGAYFGYDNISASCFVDEDGAMILRALGEGKTTGESYKKLCHDFSEKSCEEGNIHSCLEMFGNENLTFAPSPPPDTTPPELVSITVHLSDGTEKSLEKEGTGWTLQLIKGDTVSYAEAVVSEPVRLVEGADPVITMSGEGFQDVVHSTITVDSQNPTKLRITPNLDYATANVAGTFTLTMASGVIEDYAGNRNTEVTATLTVVETTSIISDRVKIIGGSAETYTLLSSRSPALSRSDEYRTPNASNKKRIMQNSNFKTSRLSHQVGEWTIYYSVGVDWEAYPGASGYRIYHSVNGGPFTLADDWPLEPGEYSPGGYAYSEDYAPGSTYSYYVVAYGPDWETTPSEIVTAPTHFLPPIFLKSPTNGSTVSGSPFTLEWEIGDIHPSIPEATDLLPETNVHVFDPITFDRYFVFEYDFVEQAMCSEELESGRYNWYVQMEGWDSAGNYISSHSDVWTFTYQ